MAFASQRRPWFTRSGKGRELLADRRGQLLDGRGLAGGKHEFHWIERAMFADDRFRYGQRDVLGLGDGVPRAVRYGVMMLKRQRAGQQVEVPDLRQ